MRFSDTITPVTLAILLLCTLGCTIGSRSVDASRTLILQGAAWRETTLPLPGGAVSYTAVAHYLDSERELYVDIEISARHSQDIYFFDPNVIDEPFTHVQLWRDGPILYAHVGSPGIREDGLLKMKLIASGKPYQTRIWLGKDLRFSNVQSIRLGLILLPDPEHSFKKMFDSLEDTGLTWFAEVSSPMWCQYMSHLVYDEITIPIRTNIHVCDK